MAVWRQRREFAETAPDAHEVVVAQILVAEEDYQIIQQRLADGADCRGVELSGEIDIADFRAERAG